MKRKRWLLIAAAGAACWAGMTGSFTADEWQEELVYNTGQEHGDAQEVMPEITSESTSESTFESTSESTSEDPDDDAELIEDPEANALPEGWEEITEGESETEPLIREDEEQETDEGSGGEPGGHAGGNTGPDPAGNDGSTPGEVTPGGSMIPIRPIGRGDYEVGGDPGEYWVDEEGSSWLAPGSSLYIRPTPESGYSGGTSLRVWESGSVTASFEQYDETGMIIARTQEFQTDWKVDRTAPAAALTLSGGTESGSIYYSNGQVVVQAAAGEDRESGIRNAVCTVTHGLGSDAQVREYAIDRETAGSRRAGILLTEEGTYAIEAEAADHVGNLGRSGERKVVIDRSDPTLEISGIEPDTSCSGEVRIRVSCEDPAYKAGSLQISMSGTGGYRPEYSRTETGEKGTLLLSDIPYDSTCDGYYTLTVQAEDLAGNTARSSISFKVNRGGSVYGLDRDTAGKLMNYYHTESFPVSFAETNLDRTEQARALIFHDGAVETLDENGGILICRDGESENVKDGTEAFAGMRYIRSYTVPADCFRQEGVYRVILMTKDRAGNSGDTQSGRCEVEFAIDRTAPQISIHGAQAGQIIQADRMLLGVEVRDNLQLKTARVYLDGELYAVCTAQELKAADQLIRLELVRKDSWQRIQVYALDEAGNEAWSETLPVYLTGENASGRIRDYEAELLKEERYRLRRELYSDRMRKRLRSLGTAVW